MSKPTRTRRHRRQAKAALRHKGAKPRHRALSGRTGGVFAKQLGSRRGPQ